MQGSPKSENKSENKSKNTSSKNISQKNLRSIPEEKMKEYAKTPENVVRRSLHSFF